MKKLVLELRRWTLRAGILLSIANIFLFNAGAANLSLHQLFSSHMVLQREANAPIWGWAPAGATVTVVVKDQNATVLQTRTSVADLNGSWQATLGPFGLVANNAAYTIVVSCPGQATITLTDVLIGDIWLGTGQSNMAYSLNVIGVTNLAQEIADSANYPKVRNFTVPNVSSSSPQTNIPSGSWQVAGPSTTGNFTATGYFTAREVYKQQSIPIGIINSAWPGSEIDSWLDPDFISGISDFAQPVFDQIGQTPGRDTISGPYNAMIAPLAPFAIKAVEWYQGEYNVSWPEQYSRLLPGLMTKWRSLFNQPDLPFIIIQLPNFGGGQTQPVENGSWAELREAQLNTVLNDPHARLVTTIDIGHGDLHPTDKQDVGLRAAWAAATLVYGQTRVDQGPVLTNFTVSGHNIICTFDNVGAGLMIGTKTLLPLSPVQEVPGGTLANFAICGANKVFFAANASITASNQVTVSSSSVSTPVAVRYAWGNNPPCNLYASMVDGSGTVTNGIPAGPGRTDPVNRLMVNLGKGTGYYASNATVSITASNLTGQTFDHWSGDTNLLSDVNTTTVTATQAVEYVSVLANFRITGAPGGLTASSSSSQVMLSWNPMVATHYNVKRSTTSGGPYSVIAPNIVSANYIDGSAVIGNTYYYVVSATNLLNEGPDSAQVSVVPNNGRPYYWTNTWDANAATSPNPADGSGSWLGSKNWWDGGT
ncbi:MAG TPA: sialate O-acetylesterase, partial [Verrucomicrobiae bacterium]|nr:sialate O-acetylesterase [Verrucomicrobiae bacterium]